jgi:hypothetical protein
MTTYVASPDGKPRGFATAAEADAYLRERREAEPPLLKCLRYYRDEISELFELACHARGKRNGRASALDKIASELLRLNNFIAHDIEEAVREATKAGAQGSQVVPGEREPAP